MDAVNSPSHYNQGKVECIDAIEAALSIDEYIGFLKGQQLKYVWRSGHKMDAKQDLAKAAWYNKRMQDLIDKMNCNTQPMTLKVAEFEPDPPAEPPHFAIQYLPLCPKWHKGNLDGLENWVGPGWYIIECNELANLLHPDPFVSRRLAQDKVDSALKHFEAMLYCAKNIVN